MATAPFRARAAEMGVGFRPGDLFSTRGGLANYLRLSFAYYGDADIEAGIEALARAIPL